MDSERRREVERIVEAAMELAASARAVYLLRECGADESLREEVEALLTLAPEAQEFLERPATEVEAAAMAGEGGNAGPAPGNLVGPYLLIEAIGSGGMGDVYRARDTRLERDVALKFLPRQLALRSQALERFQREARAASALNHRNICSIFDIGEFEGQPFLVMELMEGCTLRQRLASGTLEAGEMAALAQELASGLDAAHEKGIVHRDIKPANIFLCASGVAKILDFGLAKPVAAPTDAPAAQEPPGAGEETAASVSALLGTAPYMSPEQIRRETLDGRSDLFSLGVTLYECATGVLPFQGVRGEITRAILEQQPRPPRSLQASLPRRLEAVILKLLEKDRERRYQSARDLEADLERWRKNRAGARQRRWVWAGCVAAGLAGLFAVKEMRHRPETTPRRVAVIPLRGLENAPEQEHLAEGISEAIAADLAKLEGVRVIAWTSAKRYRESPKPVEEIARELRADLVLEGTAALQGGRVVARLQLTRADAKPLWTERFEFDAGDLQRVQREAAVEVAREIRRLSPAEEARISRRGTASREAFEAYLRGRHAWEKRTDADIQRAVEYFKAAIEADAAYAAAYAALADCHNQFATVAVGRAPGENRKLAIAAAKKALEIDGENAEAHAALGFARMYDWEFAAAEAELSRALELNPSYASARVWHSSSLVIARKFDAAMAEVDRAGELDPLSPITQTQVGWIHGLAGRNQEQIEQCRKVLAEYPSYPWAMWRLGAALVDAGNSREAIEVLEKATAESHDNPSFLGALGRAYAEAGRVEDARRILAQLSSMAARRYVTPAARAGICLGLGELDCYFEALEECFRQRTNNMAYLGLGEDSKYRAVEADPRFKDLLRRIGLKGDPVRNPPQ